MSGSSNRAAALSPGLHPARRLKPAARGDHRGFSSSMPSRAVASVGIAFAAEFPVGDDVDAGLSFPDSTMWRHPGLPEDAPRQPHIRMAVGCAAPPSTCTRGPPAIRLRIASNHSGQQQILCRFITGLLALVIVASIAFQAKVMPSDLIRVDSGSREENASNIYRPSRARRRGRPASS